MQPTSQIHWRPAPGVPMSSARRSRLPPASRATRADPFMGMVLEAVKGLQRDVMLRQSPWEKVSRGAILSAVILRELAGLILAAPYGWHAHTVYWSLERAPDGTDSAVEDCTNKPDTNRWNVLVTLGACIQTAIAWGRTFVTMAGLKLPPIAARPHQSKRRAMGPRGAGLLSWWSAPMVPGLKLIPDIGYGGSERNVLDVYIPEPSPSALAPAPVLLFVHGGVWASGEKWHYAPLAATCAQEGVVVVVMQYSLYPQVLSCEQAREVSSALTWTFHNIARFGGDPSRVFLAGHSSGAHISALALWERGCVGLRGALRACAGTEAVSDEEEQAGTEDTRQPLCFLGLSGVYDIAQHLVHETTRGVDAISCMTPANGGSPSEFAIRSPALLAAALAAALRPLPHSAASAPDLTQENSTRDGSSNVEDPARVGQSSSSRRSRWGGHEAGLPGALGDFAGSMPPSSSGIQSARSAPRAEDLVGPSGAAVSDAEWQEAIGQQLLQRISESCSLGDTDLAPALAQVLQSTPLFPPCVLFCSPGDIVVPPDTSLAFAKELRALGQRARVITYDAVGHSEFACWSLDGGDTGRSPLVKDVLGLLTGRAAVDSLNWEMVESAGGYSHKTR